MKISKYLEISEFFSAISANSTFIIESNRINQYEMNVTLTLDFGTAGLDATNDAVGRQQRRLDAERPVEEAFQLGDVDEDVVVAFQEEISCAAVASHPLESHDVLQRQIAVVVHEVALHDVTVLGVLHCHQPLRLDAVDATALTSTSGG